MGSVKKSCSLGEKGEAYSEVLRLSPGARFCGPLERELVNLGELCEHGLNETRG